MKIKTEQDDLVVINTTFGSKRQVLAWQVFRGFPQSLQTSYGIVSVTCFSIYRSLSFHDTT